MCRCFFCLVLRFYYQFVLTLSVFLLTIRFVATCRSFNWRVQLNFRFLLTWWAIKPREFRPLLVQSNSKYHTHTFMKSLIHYSIARTCWTFRQIQINKSTTIPLLPLIIIIVAVIVNRFRFVVIVNYIAHGILCSINLNWFIAESIARCFSTNIQKGNVIAGDSILVVVGVELLIQFVTFDDRVWCNFSSFALSSLYKEK